MTYKVIFEKSAQKEFEALSDGERKAIFQKLKKLEKTDKPRGYKELDGYVPLKRVKAGGVRAIYGAGRDAISATGDVHATRRASVS